MQSIAQLHARLGIPADYGSRRRLRRQRQATRLVRIADNSDGKPIRLTPNAAAAWHRMRAAAADDRVTLVPISGFRSVRRQSDIIRRKLANGQKIEAVLRLVAAPGYSEHHTGRALDIGTPGDEPLEESFARTPAFRWLKRYASEFGFHLSYPRHCASGISYEPWHWCWRHTKS